MIADLVVGLAVLLAALFVAAWALRPDLRERIEQPKYEFRDAVQRFDRTPRPPEDLSRGGRR